MTDRVRVMLHRKMEPILEKLKIETGCNSLTHLIHTLLQWIDKHPEASEPIKQWVREHDYRKERKQ